MEHADQREQPPRRVEIDRDLAVEPVHQHLGRLVVEGAARHVDGLDLLRGRGLDRLIIAVADREIIADRTAKSAKAEDDPNRLRQLLVDQITGRVRWRESVMWMAGANVTEIIELGAGKVLAGLAKRIDRDLSAVSVGVPADLDTFLKTL